MKEKKFQNLKSHDCHVLMSDKVDAIMDMISSGHGVVDPNNIPLASLVAHDDNNVDVNFIKNNNFNNNAYRNNFGNNNYRPYPANGNNSYTVFGCKELGHGIGIGADFLNSTVWCVLGIFVWKLDQIPPWNCPV